MSDNKSNILMAEIGAAVGLQGEVRLRSFAESVDSLRALSPLHTEDGRRFELASARSNAKGVIVRFKGVRNRSEAEALARTRLYVAREQLPAPAEEDYYIVDLVGCRIEDEDGQVLGEVLHVHNFGAGDVIEYGNEGSSELLAFTRENFPVVSPSTGLLVMVRPVEVVADAQNQESDDVAG